MHPLPRRILRQLIAQYGWALLEDPARVDALLADLCGPHHRERFLLVHALRERVPAELLDQSHNSKSYALRISQRLQRKYCFSAEAAIWAVESWSMALDIASPGLGVNPRAHESPNGTRPVLSNSPQHTLSQMLADYGPSLLDDPARAEALLADLCEPDFRGRFLLVHALRERIPARLQTMPQEGSAFVRQFSQQLQDRYGFSSEAADWAIDSWLFALKKSTPREEAPNPTPPTSAPRPKVTWRGVSWLIEMTWLGLKGVWQGVIWLLRMVLLGLGSMLSRLSFRQKIWLGLGLIAIVILTSEWQSVIEYTERGTDRLLSIHEWTEQKYSHFIDHVAEPLLAWLVGIPMLIAIGTIAGLLALRSLGTNRTWGRLKWLLRTTLLGLGKMLGRLSPRQKMWLGLGLIGVMALASEWHNAIVYTEGGIDWLLSIPEWTEQKYSHFVDHVAEPLLAWLVGIPGLIAVGTITGLFTISLLGPTRVWRGVTWLIGMTRLGLKGVWRGVTWLTGVTRLGLGWILSRLSLRQKMWLGLALMGVVAIVFAWHSAILYIELGIAWLPNIPGRVEERISQFVDHTEPARAWLMGIPGLIALGTLAGLSTVSLLGPKRAWRGVTWLIRLTSSGLGMTVVQLSLRQKIWLGLGLIGVVVLIFMWHAATLYTEKGFVLLLSIPEWIQESLLQFIEHISESVKGWLVGIAGLIALGTIAGLATASLLVPKRAWRSVTWLIRMILLWPGRMLDRLSPRQKVWLALGLIGIVALVSEWQSAIVYTEWGIAWLLSIPEWVEEKLSQFAGQSHLNWPTPSESVARE